MAQRVATAPAWWRSLLAAAAVASVAAFLAAPGSLVEKLRALDYGVCAQLPGHMLMPAGVELPLCARNTGIYTGVLLGTALLVAQGRWRWAAFPPRRCLAVLLLLVAAMAVDGANSVLKDLGLPHPYEPSNALRLLTGMGVGLSLAALALPIVATGFWQRRVARPSIAGSGDLAAYLGAGFAVALVILTQWAPLLYPIAIVSTLGLLLAICTMNVVLLTMALRLERAYAGPAALVAPYSAALLLAWVELFALAMLKHAILGPA